jgi:Zn-dependent alcohol dehydrogenase
MKATKMKAARLHEYAQPLVIEEIAVPNPKPEEILVNVKAGTGQDPSHHSGHQVRADQRLPRSVEDGKSSRPSVVKY